MPVHVTNTVGLQPLVRLRLLQCISIVCSYCKYMLGTGLCQLMCYAQGECSKINRTAARLRRLFVAHGGLSFGNSKLFPKVTHASLKY